jgi:hypothetical protein
MEINPSMKLKMILVISSFVVLGTIAASVAFGDSDKVNAKEEPAKVEKTVEVTETPTKELKGAIPVSDTSAPPHAYDWVADTLEEMTNPTSTSGIDEGYDIYLKAEEILDVLRKYRAEGIALEKDFQNIWVLTTVINHEQFVRTAHIGPNGEAMEKAEYADQWKPTSERTKKAYDYMKQLFNDLDIAFNRRGMGDAYGVSYALEGNNIKEMESFIRGE